MSSESTHRVLDADPEAGEYWTTYDYPSRPPSVAVPLALVEMTGDGVTDFEPLYDAKGVDPDALDETFDPALGGSNRGSRVTFSYHGFEVTVEGFGRIVIRTDGDDGTQYL